MNTMFETVQRGLILAVAAGAILLLPPAASAAEADDQYAVAAAHFDQERWGLAVEEFQAFLQKYPNDPRRTPSLYYLGEALLKLGKYADARPPFQECVERDPSGKYARAAMFRAGETAYLARDFDAAKTGLGNFRAKYPQDPLNAFVLDYLGEMALAGGDPAAAADLFREGIKLFPDAENKDALTFGLARALETLEQYPEAERLYRSLAEKSDCASADAAQFHLGALHYAAGDHRRAIECFAAFDGRFGKSPWRPVAQLGRGLALLKLDQCDEAVKQFDAVLENKAAGDELTQRALRGKVLSALQTKDHDAVDRLAAEFEQRYPEGAFVGVVRRMAARSLIERKQYGPAAERLEALSASGRGGKPDFEARYLLAVAYDGLGRHADALAAVLPAADSAVGPLKAEAQRLQGSLLVKMKKYAEAVPPLEAYLAESPGGESEAQALGELAICAARAGRLEQAKKLYAELCDKHPRSPLLAPAVERLAEAAFEADDPAWAGELSKRLASLGGTGEYDHKGQLGLAWSLFKSGKLAEADEAFAALLNGARQPPGDIAAEAAFVRGQILEQLGRDDDALKMYDRVVNSHAASGQCPDALLAAARLCGKLQRHRQAAGYYEQLAARDPQSPRFDAVLYQWAWALREAGDFEGADRVFRRLSDECPDSRFRADAVYFAAQRAYEIQDYGRAAGLIDELLSGGVEPRVREYALDLNGKIAAARSDWPKVRESFATLLDEFPGTSRRLLAEYWIAQSHYGENDLDAAAMAFDRLAEKAGQEREPWMAEIPLRRAQILALKNRWEDAYAIAVQIEKDFPGFQRQYEVDYLLGRCLANRADFQAAREQYQRTIRSTAGEKTETAAMAQWMTGETYFHQKNYPAAVKEYLRLEATYAYPTWQAASLLQAGKCHELLGDNFEAAKLYRRILKVYPNTAFVDRAKRQLDNLANAGGR